MNSIIQTFKLGYVDFNCLDLSKMTDYYENIMGFTTIENSKEERYISTGVDHHNIVLRSSNKSEISTIGYQIAQNDSLKNIQNFLTSQGIKSEIKTDYQPGIKELIELKDPDEYTIHLYQEMETPAPGYKLESIAPHKLGHLALGSLKPEASIEFYMKVLNFHYTDQIGNRAIFLTCNSDHHVLNISNFGKKMMHHVAFELKDSSHHVKSADLLGSKDFPIVWGPSRHTAGHNIASYHHDPELNVIELYTDMDKFIPELGEFDPRPWHQELPLKPKTWEGNCTWYTKFENDIIDSVLKKFEKETVL